ncbi:MAG: mechanosensitive ion channel family protein [Spirochaetota bacterium]
MKILVRVILLIGLFFPMNIYAADSQQEKLGNRESGRGVPVVITDFYNYTGSSMTYLSRYIPERIAESLEGNRNIQRIDSKRIKQAREKLGIDDKDLYSVKEIRKLLAHMQVPVGVFGRYIVQDSIVRLNYSIINNENDTVIEGREQQVKVNDDFLDNIDKFAALSAVWIVNYGISGTYEDTGRTDQTIINWVLTRLRESQLGFLVKNKWLYSLLIVLFFYVVSIISSCIFDRIIHRIIQGTSWDTDESVINAIKKPVKWIIFLVGLHLAIIPLKLSVQVTDFLTNLFIGIIIALATYMVMKVTEFFIRAWGKKVVHKLGERMDTDMVPFIIKIVNFFYLMMAALVILSKFGIEIAPLIASFGIMGFAVGFAVKDTIANLIGGMILITDESIAVGDKVVIDGDMGIINEIGMRYTKLKTFDNEIIVIPNGELVNKKFKNFVLPDPAIRVVVDFGVAYGSDVDRVEEVVLGVIGNIEQSLEDPEPRCVMISMGDFSLNFQAKFWIPLYEDQYYKQLEATKKIYNALNEANISIPFPTHTVYLHKTDK